jgi:dihydroorotate dehydrogenase (fumarate)
MDLTTEYLGLTLSNPFMPGSSPLPDELDTVKRLEDAGAAAIVLRSLFEEQVQAEELATHEAVSASMYTSPEAVSFFPDLEDYQFGPDAYLEHLRKVKDSVDVPVIASLNGTNAEGFLRFGRLIQQAGADALELNVYAPVIAPERSGQSVEDEVIQLVRVVKQGLDLPVAVKLSPFYSSPANLARSLEQAGADALVIFNRFYQPDIDIEKLEQLGAAPAAPLVGHPARPRRHRAGGHRRCAHRGRRHQGHHGRRRRGAGGLGPHRARPGVPRAAPPGRRAVARGP